MEFIEDGGDNPDRKNSNSTYSQQNINFNYWSDGKQYQYLDASENKQSHSIQEYKFWLQQLKEPMVFDEDLVHHINSLQDIESMKEKEEQQLLSPNIINYDSYNEKQEMLIILPRFNYTVFINNPKLYKQFCVERIIEYLQDIHFLGNWNSPEINDSQKRHLQYKKFTNFDGKMQEVKFKQQLIMKKNVTQISLNIFDGQYSDKNQLYIEIQMDMDRIKEIENTQVELRNLANSNTTHKYEFQEQYYNKDKKLRKCVMNMTIDFKLEHRRNIQGTHEEPQMDIQMESKECSIKFNCSLHTIDYNTASIKAIYFSIFTTMIAIVHFVVIIRIMKRIIDNEPENQKYSLVSISLCFFWDGYFTLVLILGQISNDELFQFYAIPSFIYLVLWLVFERNLITFIWKCRTTLTQENYNFLSFKFQIGLYFGFGVFVIIVHKYLFYSGFFIILNLYMVPQIIRNAVRGQQYQVDSGYIFGFLSLRSVIPVYVRGCPKSVFQLTPKPFLVGFIFLIVLLQIVILYMQSLYGMRFFIPKMFLPKKYNYFLKMSDLMAQTNDIEDDNLENDCIICMESLRNEPSIQPGENTFYNEQLNTPYMKKLRNQKNYYMLSPCNHKFHIQCLMSWMSIKMECPTCRANLPSVD